MIDPSAEIPHQGADTTPSTSCVDAKRLRCSPTPTDLFWLVPVPPLDDENLLQEILLRLPPQPSSLPRASLVCKHWRSILSDPEFLKRFRRHHRKPPLLGFFIGSPAIKHDFVPIPETKPDRIPAERFVVPKYSNPYDDWDFHGCRHGLAVLIRYCRRQAVVWDPLTGQQHRVHIPPGLHDPEMDSFWVWHASVVCANTEVGHVHGDCFSSPFKLALLCGGDTQSSACLYESASGVWGNIVTTVITSSFVSLRPSVLIGNAVYLLLSGGDILAFDIESHALCVIEKPADARCNGYWSLQLLRIEDHSGIGLVVMSDLSIQLWKRKSKCNGIFGWVLMQKTIQLEGMFPQRMPRDHKWVYLVGYDEDTNVMFMSTSIGKFMLQLDSMQIRKISKTNDKHYRVFYPYANFYTAGREVGWKWLDLEL